MHIPTLTKLKALERKARKLQEQLDATRWAWEDLKKELEAKGEPVPYDFGDVLA